MSDDPRALHENQMLTLQMQKTTAFPDFRTAFLQAISARINLSYEQERLNWIAARGISPGAAAALTRCGLQV